MTTILDLITRQGFRSTFHILTSPHSPTNRQSSPRRRYAWIRKSHTNGRTGRASIYKVVGEPDVDDQHCYTLYRRVLKHNYAKEDIEEWLSVKRDISHKQKQSKTTITNKASKEREREYDERPLENETLAAKKITAGEGPKCPRVAKENGDKEARIGDVQRDKTRSMRGQQFQHTRGCDPDYSQPSQSLPSIGDGKTKSKTSQRPATPSETVTLSPGTNTRLSPQHQRLRPWQRPPRSFDGQSTVAVRCTIKRIMSENEQQDNISSLTVPGSPFQQPGLDPHQSVRMIFGTSSRTDSHHARGLEQFDSASHVWCSSAKLET